MTFKQSPDGTAREARSVGWSVAGAMFCLALLMTGNSPAAEPAPAAARPVTVAPGAEPATIAGGPPLVRRLTEPEYRATVADIFGPDIPIVGRFEHGLRIDGLLAVGTSQAGISAFSLGQYDASAQGIAAEVVGEKHRSKLVPCQAQSETTFDADCAKQFVQHYGLLLFRRPLANEEVTRYVGAARAAQDKLGNFYQGLQYALAGMLVAPDFLVRIERAVPDPAHKGQLRLDAYSKATRVSYFLSGSSPDEELLRAAGAGELDSPAGLAKQVDRLIASPHFERGVRAFFQDMFQFDTFDEVAKDPVIYPAFNSVVARDAQEQTLRTVVDQLVTQHGDYRDIFTTRDTYLTRALGTLYRLPVATRNGWERDQFPEGSDRAGILTNVSFLALYSHPGRSSSTLRGKAVREIFMCQKVPDPPNNVDFSVVQDSSNTALPTARVRLEAHRTSPACAGCHRMIDPIGLTLENFDGSGGFRATENGAAIDASGTLDGKEFQGATGLAQTLHDNPQTARCLVDKLYRSAAGRDVSDVERPYMDFLNQSFQASGYRVPDLMRTVVLSQSFYAVSAPAADKKAPPSRTAAVPVTHGEHS